MRKTWTWANNECVCLYLRYMWHVHILYMCVWVETLWSNVKAHMFMSYQIGYWYEEENMSLMVKMCIIPNLGKCDLNMKWRREYKGKWIAKYWLLNWTIFLSGGILKPNLVTRGQAIRNTCDELFKITLCTYKSIKE